MFFPFSLTRSWLANAPDSRLLSMKPLYIMLLSREKCKMLQRVQQKARKT